MDRSSFLRAVPHIAALSSILLSFGCQSGALGGEPTARGDGAPTTDEWVTDVTYDALRRLPRGRGRQRDAGASAPVDAGSSAADAGSTTPALDAGSSMPMVDGGSTAPLVDAGSSGALDAGSSGALDAGSSTPAPDAGAPGAAAWRPFSDASPWNTRVPASVAIRPDSAALVEHLRTSSVWPGLGVNIHPWSVPLYEVDSSVPLVRVVATLSNEGQSHTFYWPVPTGAVPAAEADAHMLLVDRAAGRAYDFWAARQRSDGTWDCGVCATTDLGGTGVRPPKGGATPWYESHGSRACGFPLAAGLIRVEEIRAGRIDHALVIAYPGIRQRWFTSPASTGHPANGSISPDWGIPCGGRVQLDPSLDVDALGLSPAARIIARALQEYGAYVGDYSGSINLYADGSPDAQTAWSEGLLSGGDTRGIPLDRLRVVEWGTLRSDG